MNSALRRFAKFARWHPLLGFLYPDHLERGSILSCLLQARPAAHGRLLDAGCAHKPYSWVFSEVCSQQIGIDFEPGSAAGGPDILADVGRLPFAGDSFDTVLCTQVLEHVGDPKAVMAEFRRVLRPGGVVVMTTPQTWGLHHEPYDFYRYTKFGLTRLAESNGLEVLSLRCRGGFWVTLAQLLSVRLYGVFAGLPVAARIPVLPICALIQLSGKLIGSIDRNDGLALGHMVIARRNGEVIACGSQ